jgi:hypothetical protein
MITRDSRSFQTNLPEKGSGGLSVAQQLYNRFKDAGKPLQAGDIAIVDAAEYHNYQVCLHSIASPPLTEDASLVVGPFSPDGTSDFHFHSTPVPHSH